MFAHSDTGGMIDLLPEICRASPGRLSAAPGQQGSGQGRASKSGELHHPLPSSTLVMSRLRASSGNDFPHAMLKDLLLSLLREQAPLQL